MEPVWRAAAAARLSRYRRRAFLRHYKTGTERKDKIIKAAKQCFYEYGYKGTTIAMIAEAAGMPQSLVAYYYKKNQLLIQIYEEYILAILKAIDEQAGEALENVLQRHLLLLQLQYQGIYGDERNHAVYRYMMDNSLLSPAVNQIVDTYLLECIKEFGIDLPIEVCQQYIVAQYGAYRELVRVYLKEYHQPANGPLYYFGGTIALRLAGISEAVIAKNVEKVEQLLPRIDLSGIRFLV